MNLDVNDRRGGGRLLNSDAQRAAHIVEVFRLQSLRGRFDLACSARRIRCDHGEDHTAGLDGDGEHARRREASQLLAQARLDGVGFCFVLLDGARCLQHQSDLLGRHNLGGCARRQWWWTGRRVEKETGAAVAAVGTEVAHRTEGFPTTILANPVAGCSASVHANHGRRGPRRRGGRGRRRGGGRWWRRRWRGRWRQMGGRWRR